MLVWPRKGRALGTDGQNGFSSWVPGCLHAGFLSFPGCSHACGGNASFWLSPSLIPAANLGPGPSPAVLVSEYNLLTFLRPWRGADYCRRGARHICLTYKIVVKILTSNGRHLDGWDLLTPVRLQNWRPCKPLSSAGGPVATNTIVLQDVKECI